MDTLTLLNRAEALARQAAALAGDIRRFHSLSGAASQDLSAQVCATADRARAAESEARELRRQLDDAIRALHGRPVPRGWRRLVVRVAERVTR